MNKQQKLKLFWKITNHLNKKFCKDKIKINKIIFLRKIINPKRKDKGTTYGYYRIRDKTIAILKDAPEVYKLETLCHELAHAYQHQILRQKLTHNERGWEMMKDMLKEIDKIVRISV